MLVLALTSSLLSQRFFSFVRHSKIQSWFLYMMHGMIGHLKKYRRGSYICLYPPGN